MSFYLINILFIKKNKRDHFNRVNFIRIANEYDLSIDQLVIPIQKHIAAPCDKMTKSLSFSDTEISSYELSQSLSISTISKQSLDFSLAYNEKGRKLKRKKKATCLGSFSKKKSCIDIMDLGAHSTSLKSHNIWNYSSSMNFRSTMSIEGSSSFDIINHENFNNEAFNEQCVSSFLNLNQIIKDFEKDLVLVFLNLISFLR